MEGVVITARLVVAVVTGGGGGMQHLARLILECRLGPPLNICCFWFLIARSN